MKKFTVTALLLVLPLIPEARKAAQSEISLLRTVTGVREFKNFQINPDRYVLSQMPERPWAPVIYDIAEDKKLQLPEISSMEGIPREPALPLGKERRYKMSELILKGEYFRWQAKQVVSFDGKTAGIMLVKEAVKKTTDGPPACPKCGNSARLLEQYHRYYCDACRSYVDEKDYTATFYEPLFAAYDLASGLVSWTAPLEIDLSNPMEQGGIEPLGYDHEGGYFYYSNRVFMYKNPRSSGQILIYRFNVNSRRVDWKYRVEAPVRHKGKTAGSYSMHYFASHDMKTIVFWEYDESYGVGTAKGWLNDPPARGYIVNTAARSHKEIPVMVTPYGHTVSRDNAYVAMGSNQLGSVELFESSSGKLVKKVNAGKAIYHIQQSPDGKKLYVFNRYAVEVYSFPDLKKIKTLPLTAVFPGITKLLVSEKVLSLDEGRHFVMGVMKKTSSGHWSSDLEGGFQVYRVGD
ncbi:MAG TPA: hypothetical protein ENN21_10590 [Spirochaetes bacterium]|nr:hypothetical protein [Spirochaetota bacterium]